MFNTGKPWVTFDRPTWWMVVYGIVAIGFGLGYCFAIITQ